MGATEDNGGWRGMRKRSLVISPDLDKLLEHEERLRRSNASHDSIEAPIGSALAGLPPPPRRNRQISTHFSRRSSAKESDTSSSVVGREMLSVRSSNPYINPAPTAEELFPLLLHDSALPVPGPSQQSTRIDDQQQNSSFCPRTPATRCFRAAKGEKFAVLRIFASSTDHDRTCIPRIPEEDLSIAGDSTKVEFLGNSRAASAPSSSTGMLSNNSLDPTPHRLSVRPSHPDSKLVNQSSSSLSTSLPMATSPPGLPTSGVKPYANHKPALSRHPSLKKQSALSSLPNNVKPATTNFLDDAERADLVRKSRKLTRLFGETPNGETVVNQAGLVPTVLANGKDSEPDDAQVIPPHPDRHGPDGATAFSRRYSLPLRVDDVPSADFSTVDTDDNSGSPELWSKRPSVQSSSPHQVNSIRSCSPVSFVELSDDRSSTSVASRASSHSPSLLESERRRKRERLAKLYRFLGSQVPVNLVLGINDASAASLPPRQQHVHGCENTENRPALLRHRRSSSAIPIVSTWSGDVQRLKADLDDREKAIIVRRAQKMEKLFGVAPPLTLYYPRSASAPSSGSTTPPLLRAYKCPPYSSTALLKSSKKKDSRPATPESSKHLLPKISDSLGSSVSHSAQASNNGHSSFYNHYELSLNSLNDIIERDDKASLAELHQALHGDIVPHERPATVAYGLDEGDGTTTPTLSGRRSSISSVLPRPERRGAFPGRTSRISLDSEFNSASPPPMSQASSFQQRRKRAAKLTHFFGVQYRELFDDVLESLENDMQLDQSEGVLRAEEVEDLLQKLRKLKYKRLAFL